MVVVGVLCCFVCVWWIKKSVLLFGFQIPFFDDVGAVTLQYFDTLFQRDNLQKSQFYKGLPKVLPKLPKVKTKQRVASMKYRRFEVRIFLRPLTESCGVSNLAGVDVRVRQPGHGSLRPTQRVADCRGVHQGGVRSPHPARPHTCFQTAGADPGRNTELALRAVLVHV